MRSSLSYEYPVDVATARVWTSDTLLLRQALYRSIHSLIFIRAEQATLILCPEKDTRKLLSFVAVVPRLSLFSIYVVVNGLGLTNFTPIWEATQ